MHGGPLKPSVHLFSFGAWCKGNERTRVRGLTCTKPAPAPEEKWPGPWCKGNGGIRGSGLSCTKSSVSLGGKMARDLVQRKRRNKG